MNEEPYWRDVGTIDAYWDANIDLTATDPLLNLYDTSWPIWTYQPQLPPAKFVHNEHDRRGAAIEGSLEKMHHLGSVFRSMRSPACACTRMQRQLGRALPDVQVGRRAPHQVVVDRGCVFPTAWWSAKTPKMRGVPPQRQGVAGRATCSRS
jgi:glucose-1-phosphate adenylyltransferase